MKKRGGRESKEEFHSPKFTSAAKQLQELFCRGLMKPKRPVLRLGYQCC